MLEALVGGTTRRQTFLSAFGILALYGRTLGFEQTLLYAFHFTFRPKFLIVFAAIYTWISPRRYT
jgi:hypothetical protein